MPPELQNKLDRYYQELNELTVKFTSFGGYPTKSDLDRLLHLFRLAGIEERNIERLYSTCGFKSWDDYLKNKERGYSDTLSQVKCVDDKIWLAKRSIETITKGVL